MIKRWAGHVAGMEEGRGAFKTLTGKPAGRPLWRPRLRWKGNTRMEQRDTGNWVNLAQDSDHWSTLVNVALNLPVP